MGPLVQAEFKIQRMRQTEAYGKGEVVVPAAEIAFEHASSCSSQSERQGISRRMRYQVHEMVRRICDDSEANLVTSHVPAELNMTYEGLVNAFEKARPQLVEPPQPA